MMSPELIAASDNSCKTTNKTNHHTWYLYYIIVEFITNERLESMDTDAYMGIDIKSLIDR